MNNLMTHFSMYAISKKHTLNIIGGMKATGGGTYVCGHCSGGTITCDYGCISIDCENNVLAFKCANKSTSM